MIDGYAFSTALSSKSFNPVFQVAPNLTGIITPTIYLIRGAVSRQGTMSQSPPGRSSLAIRPLGELVDMYHARRATIRHDKVFALLGMSSDNITSELLPDYGVSWETLLERLVRFLLGETVCVKVGPGTETAKIRCGGIVLGKISSVTEANRQDNKQEVTVSLKDTSGRLGVRQDWTLSPSAKTVRVGDLVCSLNGSAKPTIIRPEGDGLSIIMISAPPLRSNRDSTKSPGMAFWLFWEWAENTVSSSRRPDCGKGDKEGFSDDETRLWDVASVLEDGEEFAMAEDMFQDFLRLSTERYGGGDTRTLTARERLGMLHKRAQNWKMARALLDEVVQARMQIQGPRHPDTLRSRELLSSAYESEGHLHPRKLRAITDILGQMGEDDAGMGKENLAKMAALLDEEVIKLLLDHMGSMIKIAEDVLTAAAGNWWAGETIMRMLLDRRGDEVKITEAVLTAAARNEWQGERLMSLLFDRRESEVRLTDAVIAAAAGNRRQGARLTKLLLERGCRDIVTGLVQNIAAPSEAQRRQQPPIPSIASSEIRNKIEFVAMDKQGLFTFPPPAPDWELWHGESALE